VQVNQKLYNSVATKFIYACVGRQLYKLMSAAGCIYNAVEVIVVDYFDPESPSNKSQQK